PRHHSLDAGPRCEWVEPLLVGGLDYRADDVPNPHSIVFRYCHVEVNEDETGYGNNGNECNPPIHDSDGTGNKGQPDESDGNAGSRIIYQQPRIEQRKQTGPECDAKLPGQVGSGGDEWDEHDPQRNEIVGIAIAARASVDRSLPRLSFEFHPIGSEGQDIGRPVHYYRGRLSGDDEARPDNEQGNGMVHI